MTAQRHVFIVSRAYPSVYDFLTRQFEADSEVEIIVDRRRSERRTAAASDVDVDRRRVDRRVSADLDARLCDRSHLFLTLPAAGQMRDGHGASPPPTGTTLA